MIRNSRSNFFRICFSLSINFFLFHLLPTHAVCTYVTFFYPNDVYVWTNETKKKKKRKKKGKKGKKRKIAALVKLQSIDRKMIIIMTDEADLSIYRLSYGPSVLRMRTREANLSKRSEKPSSSGAIRKYGSECLDREHLFSISFYFFVCLYDLWYSLILLSSSLPSCWVLNNGITDIR